MQATYTERDMSSRLTITAFYTRKYINYGILLVISYILLRIFWGVFVAIWIMVFPPKPPSADNAFQKLPAIQFPDQTIDRDSYTFQLETIQGEPPRASDTALVYHMPKSSPNFLALNKTQDFAKSLELNSEPIQENKNVYRFNDAEFPLRTLRYDIVSNNFLLRYAFEQDTSLFNNKELPLMEEALEEAANILQIHKLNVDDITQGEKKITFMKLVSDRLITTSSLSQSDAVRVDFFRRSVGDMRIFTPNPDKGQVTIIFTGNKLNKKRVAEFDYTLWLIDYETRGRYALKTSAQAWEELQSGNGYIARLPDNTNTIVVRNIYLGYYDSMESQTYLQPIFVFEGDKNFLAYIPAVALPWTE